MNKQQRYTTLVNEYNELSAKCNKLYAFINSFDFEEKAPDNLEQVLMRDQLNAMALYRNNLRSRIKLLEQQIKNDDEAMFQTQHDPNFDEVDPEQKAQALHHCGQDADDACFQARQCSTVDRDAAHAASSDDDISDEIQDLVGYQVVCAGDMACDSCPHDHYGTPCVKLELVGGYFICLVPLPNSIITQ